MKRDDFTDLKHLQGAFRMQEPFLKADKAAELDIQGDGVGALRTFLIIFIIN